MVWRVRERAKGWLKLRARACCHVSQHGPSPRNLDLRCLQRAICDGSNSRAGGGLCAMGMPAAGAGASGGWDASRRNLAHSLAKN